MPIDSEYGPLPDTQIPEWTGDIDWQDVFLAVSILNGYLTKSGARDIRCKFVVDGADQTLGDLLDGLSTAVAALEQWGDWKESGIPDID